KNFAYTLLSPGQISSESFGSSPINKDLQVQGGGLLYIGQEQDVYGGSFNPKQSLRAYVADYVMIKGLLQQADMVKFIGCENLQLSGNIIFEFSSNISLFFENGEDIVTNETI
ncbi:unnamed protein product, partial [Meganyctiphanes norvegica]